MTASNSHVKTMMTESEKGRTREQAAASANLRSRKSAAKAEKLGKLPSEMGHPRVSRTRRDAFAGNRATVGDRLEHGATLEAKVLFEWLCEVHLTNGVELLVDKQTTWCDSSGVDRNPSADLHLGRPDGAETDMIWGGRGQGRVGPSWRGQTVEDCSRVLTRIWEPARACEGEDRPLCIIGSMIVPRVAVEIKDWLDHRDLMSAYSLTKMLEQPDAE